MIVLTLSIMRLSPAKPIFVGGKHERLVQAGCLLFRFASDAIINLDVNMVAPILIL